MPRLLALALALLVVLACQDGTAPDPNSAPVGPWTQHAVTSFPTTDCANHGARGDGGVVQVVTVPARDTVWSKFPYNIDDTVAEVYRDDPWMFGQQIFCRDYDVTVTFAFPDPSYLRNADPNQQQPQGVFVMGVLPTGINVGTGRVIGSYAGKADTTVFLVRRGP